MVSEARNLDIQEGFTYQGGKIPYIYRGTPWHLKGHLWGPINMWQEKRPSALDFSDSCLSEITQD